jgi:hypothetical protein
LKSYSFECLASERAIVKEKANVNIQALYSDHANHLILVVDDFERGQAVVAAVRNEPVGLFKGAFIEQQIDPLPRRKLAFAVLTLLTGRAATLLCERIAALQLFRSRCVTHVMGIIENCVCIREKVGHAAGVARAERVRGLLCLQKDQL